MFRKIDTFDRPSHLRLSKDAALRHLAEGEWEEALMAFINRMGKHSQLCDHPALLPMRQAMASGEISSVGDVASWLAEIQ